MDKILEKKTTKTKLIPDLNKQMLVTKTQSTYSLTRAGNTTSSIEHKLTNINYFLTPTPKHIDTTYQLVQLKIHMKHTQIQIGICI